MRLRAVFTNRLEDMRLQDLAEMDVREAVPSVQVCCCAPRQGHKVATSWQVHRVLACTAEACSFLLLEAHSSSAGIIPGLALRGLIWLKPPRRCRSSSGTS